MTTQASAILEVSILAPIIEFFLQLVAMESLLVELIIVQMKVHSWATYKATWWNGEICCLQSLDQTSDVRLSRFFHFLLQLDRLQLTAVYCNRRRVWRQHIFAVWISTRNSRTGQKLNKLVQLEQFNCWHEVQSENPNNVWSDLKHLGNLWA